MTVTHSSSKTPDVQALDTLTGGAFAAQTSGERASKLRDWLLTDPSQEDLQHVFKEISTRDKGAAKVIREKLDELKRAHGQDVLAAEWAERAHAMLTASRLNIADAMAWQRDAAKAGAPLSREPLASLKVQLNEKIKAVEDLQHQVMVQRETAVLLAQRIEVLSTKSLKEADAANEVLQADVANWQLQANALTEDAAWQSVDLKFPPQLEASRHQLNSVWEAFEAALLQAKAAREDANETLPSVPVWAEELRLARGGHSVQTESAHAVAQNPLEAHKETGASQAEPSAAEDKPIKTAKLSNTKMDPAQRLALREAANQVVTGALTVLAAEPNEANLVALRQTLKDHGRNMDTNMDLKVHEALVAAGDAAGWQRYVADQLRLALVLKAEGLFKKVPVKVPESTDIPAVAQSNDSQAETSANAEVNAEVNAEPVPESVPEVLALAEAESPKLASAPAVKEAFTLEPTVGGRKMQDALRQLREEWKQADQGGLPNHALWKRFDAACNNAYKVVQNWLDKIKHEASEHRAQRLALIEEVKTWGEANAQNADWRAHLRALHQFGDRWRSAGHLSEKAFAELQPLWRQALHNAAQPLETAQKASMARRQALIAEAEQLGAAPQLRVDAVKALQLSWQTEAQSVPMDRRIEQKMWEAFRQPIDEAFSRKTNSREHHTTAPLSAHDRLVLDASNELKAANASGDVQKIKAAMAGLDAALKGQAKAVAAETVAPPVPAASEVDAEKVTEPASESAAESSAQAANEGAEPNAESVPAPEGEESPPAPVKVAEPAKPARPLVAMRGDDRPGQKKSVPAPAGRGGPGDRRDGKGGFGDKGGKFGDRGGDRGFREERPDRGPRLSETAFRAQRDAMEHAEMALRKLAAEAHGESLTHLLTAWEKRQADLVPTAQDLGRNVNSAARAAWSQAVSQAPTAAAGEAILRLEMAAEIPTPAENLNERRALQLQLLTRKNQPGPEQTWALDVTAVLSSAHDAKVARRLQNALKNLLRS